MYTINDRFEWDDAKAAANFARHGVAFEEASDVFDDSHALYSEDKSHTTTEQRFLVIGCVERGVLLVVYTLRSCRIRLISARFANRRERRFYAATQR